MATQYPLAQQSAYNFTLYAPGVLGAGYHNATVLALLDYDSAQLIEDVAALHYKALAYLPTGTVRDPSKLNWIKIRTTTGAVRAIAADWISETPRLVQATTIKIELPNLDASEAAILRQLLHKRGYLDFTVTIVAQ